jgi:hypothetical protein
MSSFTDVLREYTSWLTSIRWVKAILPYHLIFLFGGVGLLLVSDLITFVGGYQPIVFTAGHYGYFLGIILTLATSRRKYVSYAMWAYAVIVLFPFKYLSPYQLVEALIYVTLGYWLLKHETGGRGNGRPA